MKKFVVVAWVRVVDPVTRRFVVVAFQMERFEMVEVALLDKRPPLESPVKVCRAVQVLAAFVCTQVAQAMTWPFAFTEIGPVEMFDKKRLEVEAVCETYRVVAVAFFKVVEPNAKRFVVVAFQIERLEMVEEAELSSKLANVCKTDQVF